ncbi:MAG: sugar phosphate isomerase/epimerase [Vallitaleaceae bacterium]|jgi:sugar phosphate isomerase/epimerase|nr:sugar phosphate isomerase/epimerase [Vallitaleaceae bacterium]
MNKLIVAAQLYTVKDLLKDKSEGEVRNVLKQIKDIGYDAVQISGIGPVTKELALRYQTICEALELEICATHVGLSDLQEDLDWIIEYHNMWKCHYVGIGSMPNGYKTKTGVIEFAKICNELGAKLNKEGIHLVYHNHRFEFEKFGSKTMMDMLFDNFDNHVEFEIDTYWVQAGGMNPVEWIEKVDGRMGVVHFKDMRIKDDQQEFAEVGSGNLDWHQILEACRKTAVIYAAVEQDAFYEDAIESLKMSRDYIQNEFNL